MRWFAPIVALGAVCVVSLQAQQTQQAPTQPPPQTQDPITPQQPLVFRAGVDVVQFEFNAFDKEYQTIHGLTKDRIQVFEDGKQQEIVDLREIVIDEGEQAPVWSRAVSPDVTTNEVSDRRLIGLIVDDLNCCGAMGTATTDRAAAADIKAAAEYIIDSLGPRDLATVILTHEMAANQPFTGDRDVLRSVLRRFTPSTDVGCKPQPPYPSFTSDLTRMFAGASQPVKAIVVIHSNTGALGLKDMPCPQRSYVVPDLGVRRTASYAGNGAGSSLTERELQDLPPVPVYYINAGRSFEFPLRGTSLRRDRPEDTPPGEDLDKTIARIFDQNGSYYLVGFRTSKPTTDGKYRKLEVKIPGLKDFTVRARAGYVRPTPPPKPGSRAARDPELPALPASVSSLLPASDIGLKATVAAFAIPASRKYTLIVSLDLAHPIEGDVASGSENVDLRTVVYASGNTKHDVTTRVKLDVQAGIHRVAGSFPWRLDVDPDVYQLRLTARDPRTTRLGGLFYDMEIPDRTAQSVTLSSVLLGREPTDANPLPPTLAGVVPIVPVTARTFGPLEDIRAFFQIYQGMTSPAGPVTLAIRVLDDRGKTKFTSDETIGADRFSSDRIADYRLKLPLDDLSAGQYLLTIEARLGGHITPKRDVMFVVR